VPFFQIFALSAAWGECPRWGRKLSGGTGRGMFRGKCPTLCITRTVVGRTPIGQSKHQQQQFRDHGRPSGVTECRKIFRRTGLRPGPQWRSLHIRYLAGRGSLKDNENPVPALGLSNFAATLLLATENPAYATAAYKLPIPNIIIVNLPLNKQQLYSPIIWQQLINSNSRWFICSEKHNIEQ